ncbi:MAG: hypothetical protein ABL907_10705 [Hyphomicrobium sp.]
MLKRITERIWNLLSDLALYSILWTGRIVGVFLLILIVGCGTRQAERNPSLSFTK